MKTRLGNQSIVLICSFLVWLSLSIAGGVTQTNAEIPGTRCTCVFLLACHRFWGKDVYQSFTFAGQLLQRTVCIVVDAAATLDPNGVDIFFLNRGPKRNVRSSNEVKALFRDLPDGNASITIAWMITRSLIEGPTPIVPKMREIFEEKKEEIRTRKLLLLIATDGQPTDFNGHAQIDEFRQALCNRQPIDHIPVTIIACTGESANLKRLFDLFDVADQDDRQSMEYLNKWDKEIPRLDVVSDYQTERKQILNCQGQNFPFSFGDVSPWSCRMRRSLLFIDRNLVCYEDSHGWCGWLVRSIRWKESNRCS